MQIKNTEPPKAEKTSFTRRQSNAAKLAEKSSRPGPKKIKIVQTKTSKMCACRNLSNAKTPINQINRAKTCQEQKETPNKKQYTPTMNSNQSAKRKILT